ncbi:MAG: hypothetical protein JNN08_30885, partial [Bryobacterales bacterium]|nr:hypothetical protein [Bryobacterales bacterium]
VRGFHLGRFADLANSRWLVFSGSPGAASVSRQEAATLPKAGLYSVAVEQLVGFGSDGVVRLWSNSRALGVPDNPDSMVLSSDGDTIACLYRADHRVWTVRGLGRGEFAVSDWNAMPDDATELAAVADNGRSVLVSDGSNRLWLSAGDGTLAPGSPGRWGVILENGDWVQVDTEGYIDYFSTGPARVGEVRAMKPVGIGRSGECVLIADQESNAIYSIHSKTREVRRIDSTEAISRLTPIGLGMYLVTAPDVSVPLLLDTMTANPRIVSALEGGER